MLAGAVKRRQVALDARLATFKVLMIVHVWIFLTTVNEAAPFLATVADLDNNVLSFLIYKNKMHSSQVLVM